MQLAVCQICKYPVWSYICPDCLAREIDRWLPRNLSGEFRKFSRFLLEHFASFESSLTKIICLKCHVQKEVSLCSFCYITEVFEWLHEKNSELAKTLFMTLPMDASARISGSARNFWTQITPISYVEKPDAAEGICEECGEYSDETELSDGIWLCSGCKESK